MKGKPGCMYQIIAGGYSSYVYEWVLMDSQSYGLSMLDVDFAVENLLHFYYSSFAGVNMPIPKQALQ